MKRRLRIVVAVCLAAHLGADGIAAAQEPRTLVSGPDQVVSSDQAPVVAAPALTSSGVAQEPPQPESTGFRSLARETGRDFKAFPQRKSTWVILGVSAAGAGLAHFVDDDVQEHFASSTGGGAFWAPGKWLGSAWVQGGTAVGLYLVGRYVVPEAKDEPRTNKLSHLGMDLIRAQLVSQAFVHGIKYTVRRDRPTGECCSFPSGHAASAFAAASVLERHFGGYRGAWPTLVVASYVAASRIHDNRHFLSDVVFGAGLGMASGWTVVGRHGRSEFAVMPVPVKGGVMITAWRR